MLKTIGYSLYDKLANRYFNFKSRYWEPEEEFDANHITTNKAAKWNKSYYGKGVRKNNLELITFTCISDKSLI